MLLLCSKNNIIVKLIKCMNCNIISDAALDCAVRNPRIATKCIIVYEMI